MKYKVYKVKLYIYIYIDKTKFNSRFYERIITYFHVHLIVEIMQYRLHDTYTSIT